MKPTDKPEMVVTTFRLPRALIDAVKRKAKRQERSLNWYIKKLLERDAAQESRS